MGSAKHLLVTHADDSWRRIDVMAAVAADRNTDDTSCGWGWRVVAFGTEYTADATLMRQVAAATDAPVLLGSIDSEETLFLRGLSDNGYWDTWTRTGNYTEGIAYRQLGSLTELFDEGGRDGIDVAYQTAEVAVEEMLTRTIPTVVDNLTAWAAAAGRPVDPANLRTIIEAGDHFAIRFLSDLLTEMDFIPI